MRPAGRGGTLRGRTTGAAAVVLAAAACLLTAVPAASAGPTAACWRDGGELLAALADGQLHVARVGDHLEALATVLAPGVTTVVAGTWRGRPALLGGAGPSLLRLDLAARRWEVIARLPAPVRQVVAAGDEAFVLTGDPAARIPEDGELYRVRLDPPARVRRAGLEPGIRPWRLSWAPVPSEPRLAVCTYKATPLSPFPHACLFVYTPLPDRLLPRWLGSRLTRPYVDAAHADLRHDGSWRLVTLEEAAGGLGLTCYRPAGFGYEVEWMAAGLPGAERVVAVGDAVLLWGRAAGSARLWRVLPEGEGCRLAPLSPAPPDPESLTRISATHAAGRWEGRWHRVDLGGVP